MSVATKPGATTRPLASNSSAPSASMFSPTAATSHTTSRSGSLTTSSVIVQASDAASAARLVNAVGGTVTHELGIIRAVGAKLLPAQIEAVEGLKELLIEADVLSRYGLEDKAIEKILSHMICHQLRRKSASEPL